MQSYGIMLLEKIERRRIMRRNFFKVVILVSIACIISGCSKSNVNIGEVYTKPTPMPTSVPTSTPTPTLTPTLMPTDTPVPSNQLSIDTHTETIDEEKSYGYYYDQLTKEQKVIYLSIFSYYEKIQKEFIEFIGGVPQDVEKVINAINMDQLFLGVNEKYYYLQNDDGVSVKVEVSEKISTQMNKEVEKKAEKILQKINGTDKEATIRKIYNWCTKNIKYDKTISKKHIRDVYGALINKEAVCVGYAKAFKYLCDKAEINCILIKNKTHAWNYVQLDGRWYSVDTTGGQVNTKNFLLEGKESLENESHIPDNSYFVLPTLAEKSFYPADDEVLRIQSDLQNDVQVAEERMAGIEEGEYDKGEYQLLYSIHEKAEGILDKINESAYYYYINTSEFSKEYNELGTLIKVLNEI